MPPHRFDAVVCDNDGCLVAETNEPFDLERLGAIAAHNRAAIARRDRPVLTVCSGRPQPFVEAVSRAIANTELPCVAENGAWLYHPGTNAYELDPSIGDADLEAVRAAEAWLASTYAPRGASIQPGKTAMISLYHPDPAELARIEPEARDAFAERGWGLRLSRTVTYLNADIERVSKATGIDRLVRAAGLGPARLAGIGDTAGDLAIRERVAFFACPANATPEIRAAADYVSPFEEAAGVVDILRRIGADLD